MLEEQNVENFAFFTQYPTFFISRSNFLYCTICTSTDQHFKVGLRLWTITAVGLYTSVHRLRTRPNRILRKERKERNCHVRRLYPSSYVRATFRSGIGFKRILKSNPMRSEEVKWVYNQSSWVYHPREFTCTIKIPSQSQYYHWAKQNWAFWPILTLTLKSEARTEKP